MAKIATAVATGVSAALGPWAGGRLLAMVKTVRPHTYDDVIYIGHYFREGLPVVMDLTALPNPDAQAFVDFAAGLIVGRGGAMERVAPKVFLLRPARA